MNPFSAELKTVHLNGVQLREVETGKKQVLWSIENAVSLLSSEFLLLVCAVRVLAVMNWGVTAPF